MSQGTYAYDGDDYMLFLSDFGFDRSSILPSLTLFALFYVGLTMCVCVCVCVYVLYAAMRRKKTNIVETNRSDATGLLVYSCHMISFCKA